MRLENILALTQGSLKNSPFVTSFDGITHEARRVKRGDLYLAVDPAAIEEAVTNGAYGIIFDKPTQISDSEIAWIKVDSVENALMRLLRFHLIEKELDVYSCDAITLKLAFQVMTANDLIVASGDITELFKLFWECEKGSTVLFCPHETDSGLFASSHEMPHLVTEPITIIEQTLFETSFICNDVFYERQLLSPFFIPYLEQLLHFLKFKQIAYRLRPFTPIPHFEAVFTNSRFERKDFGASDKVLIFEPSFELVGPQIEFLKRQANWAKIIYIVPEEKKRLLTEEDNIFTYTTKRDIIDVLKKADFHFALITGEQKSLLDDPSFKAQNEQLTLDF